jgi:hypothetical protein
MATIATDALDLTALQPMLGPHLAAAQVAFIFEQGQEAVVFAPLYFLR